MKRKQEETGEKKLWKGITKQFIEICNPEMVVRLEVEDLESERVVKEPKRPKVNSFTLQQIKIDVAMRDIKKLGKVAAFYRNPGASFIAACTRAENILKLKPGTLNTKRQASKWLMQRGAAYKYGR